MDEMTMISSAPLDGERLLIVRLAGEIAIKSKRTRSAFLNRLEKNLRAALGSAGGAFSITPDWSRMLVRAEPARALPVLSRVFGVNAVAVVEAEVPARLEEIVRAGADLFTERVRGRTYAVRARRAGRHPFRSHDVEVQLGAALNGAGKVNLTTPEVTVHVEVRDREAWLYTEEVAGAGGFPLGVGGEAIALMSGGYDSAVAAWLVMKRGVRLDFVFCNLGGDAYERAVVQVSKALSDAWAFGARPRLHVVDFGELLDEIRGKVHQRFWQVVLKRLMYRTASAVAAGTGAQAIVTGEALGQVSSQTLTNLCALEPAASLPVLRPLIAFDKEEIVARARMIGTASLSEQVKEYCAIAPGKPATAAREEVVAEEEGKIDRAAIERAVAGRKVLDLRALTSTDLVAPYIFTDTVPAGAVVFDCRPEAQYRAWHLPGAERRDEWELLSGAKKLDRDTTYILYCAHGTQTAYLAERLQQHGLEVYSFRGGVRAVMRYAEEREGVAAE
jgi:thiamine biosynthesis protein ThiI